MARVVVEFVELPRFRDDVALFTVTEGEIERIKRNLARDPFLGQRIAAQPGLFEYEYRREIVTYLLELTANCQRIYLLTIEPKEQRSRRVRQDKAIEKWLGRIGKLIRIWVGWPRE